MTNTQYVLNTPAETLELKIEIWEARRVYAEQHDRKRVPEIKAALADLRAKLAAL